MSLAKKVTGYLENQLNLDPSRSEVIHYGLLSLILTWTGIAAVLIPAFFLGLFSEAAVVLLVLISYRKASGGAHCDTAVGCLITGTVVGLGLSYLAAKTAPLLTGVPAALVLPPLLCLPVASRFAPADVPQKPITSKRQRSILRALTFIFLVGWSLSGVVSLITQSTLLAYVTAAGNPAILWQTFLITPPGFRFIHSLDKTFFST